MTGVQTCALPISLLGKEGHRRRITGPAEPFVAETAEQFYRATYYVALDTAVNQLTVRLDKTSLGVHTYLLLEKALLTKHVDITVCNQYPELNVTSLRVQLQMFHISNNTKSLSQAQDILKNMSPEVRMLLSEVE